ncbi:zinc finger A20 and AN1 domain-containing stress-associated protein 6-like [Cucurbita maxima]|uniref:Zinc finger A20 and AN1 domain-containing stress-associated protein 6-like n=1 Tax=Cucurbita maxima TaxID=3661 RepID=A0A6J1HX06_CUCMA|nr:zinc finger A20 and AN1 domain-containing stress-associated protein 6-like [Cucurbita maxima]
MPLSLYNRLRPCTKSTQTAKSPPKSRTRKNEEEEEEEDLMAGFGSSENPDDSPLCANNCGFFGNPKTRNLCSICYTDFLKENLISIPTETDGVSQRRQDFDDSLKSDLESIEVSESEVAMNPSCSETDSNAPARKNRCGLCNKKVGLLGFPCRCGGLFCRMHRFEDKHGCNFDTKTVERERLGRQMIEIKGDKLEYRV